MVIADHDKSHHKVLLWLRGRCKLSGRNSLDALVMILCKSVMSVCHFVCLTCKRLQLTSTCICYSDHAAIACIIPMMGASECHSNLQCADTCYFPIWEWSRLYVLANSVCVSCVKTKARCGKYKWLWMQCSAFVRSWKFYGSIFLNFLFSQLSFVSNIYYSFIDLRRNILKRWWWDVE